jgi:hypothetical protein
MSPTTRRSTNSIMTPKGIEFRDRLLSLLDPELAPVPAHAASADSSPYLAPTPK